MRQFRSLFKRELLRAQAQARSSCGPSFATTSVFRGALITTPAFRSSLPPIWLAVLAAGTSDDWRRQQGFREEIAQIQQRLREIEREAPGLIASPQFHDEFVMLLKLLDKHPIDERDVAKLHEIIEKLEHEKQFIPAKDDQIKFKDEDKKTMMEKIKSHLPGTNEHAITKDKDGDAIPKSSATKNDEYWKEFRKQHEKDWDKDEKELKDKYYTKKAEWKAKYEQWKKKHSRMGTKGKGMAK